MAKYQKLAKDAIEDIFSRDKIPVIAGGTGLYLNSLLYEMNFAETPSDNKFRDEMYELAEKQGATALHNKLKEIDLKAAMRIHPNNIKRVIRALEAAHHGCSVKNFNQQEYQPEKGPRTKSRKRAQEKRSTVAKRDQLSRA